VEGNLEIELALVEKDIAACSDVYLDVEAQTEEAIRFKIKT
jgi:hypothetical protein